ncbi:NADPH-dependent FMN reductase [Cerasicoccus fimbriatus]|uniref:NADPH-dependent FMN reductase n=1 Tax=Cerasicoccus fimbriatus TaxID=3014554 RepID=UPI0022B2CBF8|nr:NAD(P)H-dependent oxidoreductase [Cerasicoccus sp. TK19100]
MSKSKSPLLIISCSLNPGSRSRIMAQAAQAKLEGAEWIDLAETELPLCDGGAAYGHENVSAIAEKIKAAKGILVATPIYNYDVNAALKNMLELTGRHWTGKVVGFLCAAGGDGSYMSIMALANSLMLDFRAVIVPRFVYATGRHFEGPSIADAELKRRIDALCDDLSNFSSALDGLTEKLDA